MTHEISGILFYIETFSYSLIRWQRVPKQPVFTRWDMHGSTRIFLLYVPPRVSWRHLRRRYSLLWLFYDDDTEHDDDFMLMLISISVIFVIIIILIIVIIFIIM